MLAVVGAVLGLGITTGCGGGGSDGFAVSTNPVHITSTVLPNVLTGQVVAAPIQFTGGSGGPYVLETIGGDIPDGIVLDNSTVSLTGRPLEDGPFDFTLKLTDSGSQPFSTTTANFHWVIGQGPLVMITDAVLPNFTFNVFSAVQLEAAGGQPPYSAALIDLPGVPDDEAFPTGLSIPAGTMTIVGAPQAAKLFNAPYKVSIRVTDSSPIPQTVDRTFTFAVVVPVLVIVTSAVPSGTCGTAYQAQIEVAEGVPPFRHSLVDPVLDVGTTPYDVNTHRLLGEPGSLGGVAKTSFRSAYAADGTVGPYTGLFPEGIYLRETTGDFFGTPRRVGSFNNWMYQVQSTIRPDDLTQNKWKTFSFSMAAGPGMTLDPAAMPAGQGYTAPNNKLPTVDVGRTYLQTFAALGGIPYDGKYDAPHEFQLASNPGEPTGKLDWSAVFAVPGRPGNLNMEFTNGGLFRNLTGFLVNGTKGGFENMTFTVKDLQLPTSLQHTSAATVQYDIGPDTIVMAEASTGGAGTGIDNTYDAPNQTVEIYETFSAASGGSSVRALTSADFVAGQSVSPAGNSLATALSSIDFLSVSVNPTWWAYDNFNFNPSGARGFQHADPERLFYHTDFGSDHNYTLRAYGYYMPTGGMEHASNSAIELPAVTTIAANNAAGIYTNGGLLYGYENSTEFGFFIVRKNSKIYIPFSMAKASTKGFGDCWCINSTAGNSAMRKPQITVSPDGRWAAAKIKLNVGTWLEANTTSSQIVIFSLCGERPSFFGGTNTYRVISTGGTTGSGSTTEGLYLYADSLTLTNRYLYWMTGNYYGNTDSSYVAGTAALYAEHWVWRYDLQRTVAPFTGARLCPNGTVVAGQTTNVTSTYWTNQNTSSATSLSMPWHRWGHPGTGSNTSYNYAYYAELLSTYAATAGNTYLAADFFPGNFANFAENSMATTPFRVSANGKACVIVASPNSIGGSVSTANFLTHYLFCDFDTGSATVDASDFRMIQHATAPTARRFRGASRIGGNRKADSGMGYSISTSYGSYMNGWFDGPATQMEVSDDGRFVAAVFNNSPGVAWAAQQGYNYVPSYREDIALCKASGSATQPWATTVEDATITSSTFLGGNIWKFGALAFTRDASGFVFWGGCGYYYSNQASYSYNNYILNEGTLYCYNILTNARQMILAQTDGGNQDGTSSIPVTYGSITYTISAGTTYGSMGSIKPLACWYSGDGNFYYMMSLGALSSGNQTGQRFVGVNVKGNPAVGANTVNGKVPLVGFAPSWPSARGLPFGNATTTAKYCGWQIMGSGGCGSFVGSTMGLTSAGGGVSNGLLFFVGTYQGTVSYQYTGSTGMYYYVGGPARPTLTGDNNGYVYYGSFGGSAELLAMDTNVGGVVYNVTNFGGTQTPVRMISYIQPNATGTCCAIVYYTSSTSYTPYFSHRPEQEQVAIVTNMTWVASNGSLSTSPAVSVIETTPGRAGVSMCFDPNSTGLLYAFTTTGGEANQLMVTKKFDPSSASVLSTVTRGGINGAASAARFAILNAAR
jgi:hypothetical protein